MIKAIVGMLDWCVGTRRDSAARGMFALVAVFAVGTALLAALHSWINDF